MDKNFDNNLNAWLSAILGLNAIIATIAAGKNVWDIIFYTDSAELLWYSIYDIAVQALFVFGCVKLFFASRLGFYVIVSVCLLNAVTGGLLYYLYKDMDDAFLQQVMQESAVKMICFNLIKIVFFMLLMLLRDKGKNAYQVLWGKD